MASATELLNQALQAVKELEDQVQGASPLQAQLDKDRADLEEFAKQLEARIVSIEERERKVEAVKAQLKEQIKGQTKTDGEA